MDKLTKAYVYECASNFADALNVSLSDTQKTVDRITFYQVGKDSVNNIYLGFYRNKIYYGKLNLTSEEDLFSYSEIKEKPTYLGKYK